MLSVGIVSGGAAGTQHITIMFKKLLTVVLFLGSMSCGAWAGTPLTRGTALQIRLVESLSSKNGGAEAVGLVGYDVKADGKVLIKAGTPVQLQVERTKRRGVGRPGSLTVKPLTTTSVDGQTIVLSGGTLNVEGKKRTGKAVGLGVGLGVGLLCPPLLACLAIKGDHAVIESSTIMSNVFVANEYTIE